MGRKKPVLTEIPILRSKEDANEVLAKIAEHNRTLALIQISGQEKIDAIKADVSAEMATTKEEVTRLEQSLCRYAEYEKAELFPKKKSLELSFGSIGFRQSTVAKTLSKWTWERVLGALKEKKLTSCIRIKEEVDKDALRGLEPDVLAEIGAKLVSEDTFFYEINDEALASTDA